MGIVHQTIYLPLDDDPDDYRPTSSLCLHVDPDARTQLSVIRERIGVGDRIPRHWHDVDEVVMYERGHALVFLDGEEVEVKPGATVFIPSGTIHGTVNLGDEPVEVRAVFPATSVRMDLVERNAQPGTEDRAPHAVIYDMATGEFTTLGETVLPPGG